MLQLSTTSPTIKYRGQLCTLVDEVCARWRITPAELRDRAFGKHYRSSRARFEFFYRAFSETNHTLVRIIQLSGMTFNHSTAMHDIAAYCVKKDLPLPRGKNWRLYHKLKNKKDQERQRG